MDDMVHERDITVYNIQAVCPHPYSRNRSRRGLTDANQLRLARDVSKIPEVRAA
jgi:hypothetical protein